jgi:ubiquinone/menaquinone biosynthesis C-methylase UbiE
MGFYTDHVLPYLVHLSMRQRTFATYRKRVVAAAEGRVLEIGVGSGHNFPFYPESVRRVIGVDPSPKLLAIAGRTARGVPYSIDLLEGSAEAIPLEDQSVDTVVITWSLCSIPDARNALAEMRRVLKPAGHLLFVEHGRSPEEGVRRWQDRLTPAWKRIAGGCHLNRPVKELLEQGGFLIEHLATGYMTGPKPMTFMYEGDARPR